MGDLQASLAEQAAKSESLQESLKRMGSSERANLRRRSMEVSDHIEDMAKQLQKQRKETSKLRRQLDTLKTKAAERGIFLAESAETSLSAEDVAGGSDDARSHE